MWDVLLLSPEKYCKEGLYFICVDTEGCEERHVKVCVQVYLRPPLRTAYRQAQQSGVAPDHCSHRQHASWHVQTARCHSPTIVQLDPWQMNPNEIWDCDRRRCNGWDACNLQSRMGHSDVTGADEHRSVSSTRPWQNDRRGTTCMDLLLMTKMSMYDYRLTQCKRASPPPCLPVQLGCVTLLSIQYRNNLSLAEAGLCAQAYGL